MLKAEYTSVVPNDLARFFKTYERSTVMERKTALRDQILKLIYWLVHWETWHWIIKYIPLVPFWILYFIRAR